MAGLTLSASDYTLFDGQQAVTFTKGATGGASVNVANAMGLGPERREVQTDGGFVYQIVQQWFLPKAQMGGLVPEEGDFVTDAGGIKWWLNAEIEQTAANLAGTGDMYSFTAVQNR